MKKYLVERELDITRIAGKRDLNNRSIELFTRHHRLILVVGELLRLDNHLAIVAAQLAQHSIGSHGYGLVRAAERAPQALNKIGAHRLDVIVQIVRQQVVHAQLQRSQTLIKYKKSIK